MLNNKSGKILTIFLVIIAVLLISLTAISLFFFNEEVKSRKDKEQVIASQEQMIADFKTQLEAAKKEVFVLKEKNKEADDRINDLSDELELEQGLQEEFKTEAQALREKMDAANKEKEKLREKMTNNLIESEKKIADLEAKLKEQQDLKASYDEKIKEYEDKVLKLQEEMSQKTSAIDASRAAIEADQNKEITATAESAVVDVTPSVELQEIVVAPAGISDGRVITVDKDTEFVIISLGKKHGLKEGDIYSVKRGEQFLGDIRVTRVQPEMSAADLIPPFAVTMVRKNDQVVEQQ